jgi:hypothetical protein
MSRDVGDAIAIMRRLLSRRNEFDPNADFQMMLSYLNDFIKFTMATDVNVFELQGTLEFTIDETVTDGVYTLNDVGASSDFVNITHGAFVDDQDLTIWQNPKTFFHKWNTFDVTELTAGMPTDMLYYGDQFTFRTIPDQEYTVRIYGYKENEEFVNDSDLLPYEYWVRYVAYGAGRNYAQDFNYEQARIASIEKGYMREKKLLLTRTHNQIKKSRTIPQF